MQFEPVKQYGTLKLCLSMVLLLLAFLTSFIVSTFELLASAFATIGATYIAVHAIPPKQVSAFTKATDRLFNWLMVGLAFCAGWYGLADNVLVAIRGKITELETAGQITTSLNEIDLVAFITLVTPFIFFPIAIVVLIALIKNVWNADLTPIDTG